MKQIYKNISTLKYLLVVTFLLSGCSGLPDGLVQQASVMPTTLSQLQVLIDSQQSNFDNLNQDKEWSFIKPYLEKEQWSKHFKTANDKMNLANDLYNSQILAMLDRDEPEEKTAFSELITQFNAHINASTLAANQSELRFKFLILVRDTTSGIYKKANLEYSNLKSSAKTFINKANKAIADYPQKNDDIKGKIAAHNQIVTIGDNSILQIETQFNKKSDIDYAILGDQAVLLTMTLEDLSKYQESTSKKLSSLYKSYTKVLADLRVDYFVVIERATWCEGEYCGNGSTVAYPAIKVDDKMFEYFEALTTETIATERSSFGSKRFKLNIPDANWQSLGINKQWNRSRGDNYADYWVAKLYTDTYHKYTVITNDQLSEQSWQKVSNDYFWENYDNLGMALITKPYGYYEEDTLKDAQPVGMATIAKPTLQNGVASGSNQYGEWRHENGRSFWHYYVMYRIFSPSRYYYNDWYGYSRHSRGTPYYGRNNQYGTWGSNTYSNSRYSNSDFARRNPNSVKEARTNNSSKAGSSIRGAGASTRSRGPSGGGK